GIWFREESVEWWTSVSDVIVVANVVGTKPIEGDVDLSSEECRSETLICDVTDVLLGQHGKKISFRQEYYWGPKDPGDYDGFQPRRVRIGDKVLLFLARESWLIELKLAHRINLTKPAARFEAFTAYDNDC